MNLRNEGYSCRIPLLQHIAMLKEMCNCLDEILSNLFPIYCSVCLFGAEDWNICQRVFYFCWRIFEIVSCVCLLVGLCSLLDICTICLQKFLIITWEYCLYTLFFLQLACHTLNSSRSAYQSITFKPDFFDAYTISGTQVQCSVLLKVRFYGLCFFELHWLCTLIFYSNCDKYRLFVLFLGHLLQVSII